MYTPVLLLAFSSQVCGAVAPTPEWNTDYAAALKKGEQAQKPLAVVIGAGEGGWSKLGKDGEISFEARKLLIERYVCVYIDAADKNQQSLAEAFEANGRPILVLSDATRVIQVHRQTGPVANEQLALTLQRHAPAPVAQPGSGNVIRSSYYQGSTPTVVECRT